MVTILTNIKKTPYTKTFDENLIPGHKIRVIGSIPKNARRISVNFVCNDHGNISPHNDIPLHIDFRLNDKIIVRNCYFYGKWGSEEREGGCPVEKETIFELIVLIQENCYRIAINGNHFCDFEHRLPISKVKSLEIFHDIVVSVITIENPGIGKNLEYPHPLPIYKNEPYIVPVLGTCLKIGQCVIIHGKTTWDAKRLTINLLNAYNNNLENVIDGQIPLHLDVRFSNQLIVRNSYIDGWQKEERSGVCPIVANKYYCMHILVNEFDYEIKINGKHFCTYKHRLAPTGVKFVSVIGDTSVEALSFTPTPSIRELLMTEIRSGKKYL